jgi:Ca-activated chloride channel family protein
MTTLRVEPIDEHPGAEPEADQQSERGLGALQTERGNLPLESIDVKARITGLVSRIELTQGFHNPHDQPLEATYIFPLPDRAAVTAMTLTAADRTVTAQLKERAEARAEYDKAIAAGQRAAIAEEERPDVFTMRVGNILPGERVTVALTLIGPLSYEDGEATFRLPLVVAPRYIPGTPIGSSVGDGWAPDTDAVPDASRITPPVLLPGFPNPVRLSIGVDIDPAGLPLETVRSSLHAVHREGSHIEIQPGERVNRDFILRLAYGRSSDDGGSETGAPGVGVPAAGAPAAGAPAATAQSLVLTRDEGGSDGGEGTFRLTILPPVSAAPPKPRDVVLVLDRSGSMSGWKMVAARRAAARIVDTLTAADRFAVIAFDDRVEYPTRLGPGHAHGAPRAEQGPGHAHGAPRAEQSRGLHPATDRNRYAAVEFLSRMDARGGTELLAPLTEALGLLADSPAPGASARDRVVVLVTDGQVGNEDQILAQAAAKIAGIRVHTVGIDQAVNAGFLGRLAALGGGRCELVESEDRLDEAMDHIHRRIGAPVVTGLRLTVDGLLIEPETVSPRPAAGVDPTAIALPDLFPGAPLVVTGRYRASTTDPGASVTAVVTGRTRPGDPWSIRVPGVTVRDETLTAVWARAHLRDLEDRYASLPYGMGGDELERTIVATSLRYGVLCRFTAWVAVDERVVAEGGEPHRVVQPVELPSGWEAPRAPGMLLTAAAMPAPGAAPMVGGMPRPAAAPRGLPLFRRKHATGAPRPADAAAVPPGWGAIEAEVTLGGGLTPDGVPQAVREVAVQEAERLRAAAEAPEYERRELLADLGTRLAAFVKTFGEGRAVTAVRSLVADLAEDRLAGVSGAELARLWDRALAVLDALAAGTAPASPEQEAGPGQDAGPGDGPGPSQPRAFWKRG